MIKRRLVIEIGASYQVGLPTCMFFAIPKRLIIKALPSRRMAGLHRSWCFSAIGGFEHGFRAREPTVSIFRTGWYDSTRKQEPMECFAIAAVRR